MSSTPTRLKNGVLVNSFIMISAFRALQNRDLLTVRLFICHMANIVDNY